MTKVISLSEEAYAELKKRKGKDESFSDVVVRMTKERRSGSILPFAGTWVGDDAEEIAKRIAKDRETAKSREFQP